MNKKAISLTLAAMLALGATPAYASIADENVVLQGQMNTETGEINVLVDNTTPAPAYTALPNNEIRVVVSDKELTARGVAIEGRTLVPLRALGEALGATVNWDADKQEIRIEKMLYNANSKGIVTESNRVILMNIGSKQILKNGTAEELDVAPQIIGGSTMVPVRAVTDFLEATIDWDEASRTVKVQPTMATSINGAIVEEQNQQIGYENAVAKRLSELDKQAEIEKEQYKAENRPKGDMKAWGYSIAAISTNRNPKVPSYGLKFIFYSNGAYADEETDLNQVEFRLSVTNKDSGLEEYSAVFKYAELEKWSDYRKLIIPQQYLDEDVYDYSFTVVV